LIGFALPLTLEAAPSQRALPLHADPSLWLNLVEIWFSILEGKSLRGTSFNSVK